MSEFWSYIQDIESVQSHLTETRDALNLLNDRGQQEAPYDPAKCGAGELESYAKRVQMYMSAYEVVLRELTRNIADLERDIDAIYECRRVNAKAATVEPVAASPED